MNFELCFEQENRACMIQEIFEVISNDGDIVCDLLFD